MDIKLNINDLYLVEDFEGKEVVCLKDDLLCTVKGIKLMDCMKLKTNHVTFIEGITYSIMGTRYTLMTRYLQNKWDILRVIS